MNYTRQYENRINWENSPSTNTPINATNLNKMDVALQYMDGKLSEAVQDGIVEANPSDIATGTLEKLGINGTVYNIAGTNIEPNTGTPTAELKKLKVGSTVYNADGIKAYNATAISSGSISVSVPNAGHLNGEIIAVNTGSMTGTTSNAWVLSLIDGMTIEALTVSKADGTAFTDAITANELLFVKCNTSNDTAVLLGIAGASGGMPENPLATSHGGTGNADGFIRTGQKSGTTIGTNATAEGYSTTASGNYSHAEGENTTASTRGTHAEGINTTASNVCAHAEGQNTTAGGYASHAGGYYTSASQSYQTAIGLLNDNKTTTLFEVGNGTGQNTKSNAFEVYNDGKTSWDNGASKFQFTQSGGVDGYNDASGTFHAFGSGSVGVTDVSWDSTNKKLKQTKNGSTTDIVTGSTILDGLTSSQVTTALGYTPPQQDTNTHRPIKVNGTQVLGDNVTPLNLVAGANVTLTESSGSVQISASGGGSGGASISKTRYRVQASSWSSNTDEDGYHVLTINTSPVLSDSFSPNISIANNGNIDNIPTASEIYAFECLDKANMQSNALVLYARVKPTTDFWIWVEGDNA